MRVIRPMLRLLVVVVVLGVLLLACEGDGTEHIADRSDEVPDEIITDFTTEESDSGLVKWRLSAPTANKFNSRKMFLMDKPRIEFYDELGALQTTLTADNGEYSQETRNMLAYGNVVVVSVTGDILETDSLRYLNGEDKILSDSAVKLTRENGVYTGIGLECDHSLSSVDIKKDFEATIIDDGERIDG